MSHWELPYSKIRSVKDILVNDYAINPLMFKNEQTGLGITINRIGLRRLSGHVHLTSRFPAGPDAPRSLELYKYYVDFAAENGLEYMTLDAGWDNSYIEELCRYAAETDVNSIETNKSLPMTVQYDKNNRSIQVKTDDKTLRVILTDVVGRVVENSEATGSLIISAGNLPNGTYILTVVERNTKKSVKVSVY